MESKKYVKPTFRDMNDEELFETSGGLVFAVFLILVGVYTVALGAAVVVVGGAWCWVVGPGPVKK